MARTSQDERSTAEIEEDLEQTRRQISRTIDAIQSRMTPGQVFQEFYDLARGGPTDYVRNLGLAAKNNPVPVALVGVGLAWLATSGGRTPSYLRGTREPGYAPRPRDSAGVLREAGGTAKDYARSAAGYGASVVQTAASAGSEARDTAGAYATDAAEAARVLARDTSESVRLMAEDARELAAEWREGAVAVGAESRERARRMGQGIQDRAEKVWRDQPLVVGAVGLAIGALLGALLPATEQENEVMGEARDRLVSQAKTAGAGALQQASDTAVDIGKAAAEAVESRLAADSSGNDRADTDTPSAPVRAR